MYHSAEDFVADTRLVFENAIAYFPVRGRVRWLLPHPRPSHRGPVQEGDPMRNAAESLLQAFEDRIQRETQQSAWRALRKGAAVSDLTPPPSPWLRRRHAGAGPRI